MVIRSFVCVLFFFFLFSKSRYNDAIYSAYNGNGDNNTFCILPGLHLAVATIITNTNLQSVPQRCNFGSRPTHNRCLFFLVVLSSIRDVVALILFLLSTTMSTSFVYPRTEETTTIKKSTERRRRQKNIYWTNEQTKRNSIRKRNIERWARISRRGKPLCIPFTFHFII